MPETLSSSTTTLNDRYAIDRALGAGDATLVYRARDREAGGLVVLRVLRRELAGEGGTELFLHGAKLIGGLQHPNILPVSDFGVGRGPGGEEVVYAASPYLEDGTLRERLERQPQLPLDEVLRIAGSVASALDFAHRRNLIHEAIRPECVRFRGSEPLLDFGVGLGVAPRAVADTPALPAAARAASYASPEQLAGKPTDTRSDQYAFGVLVYEMLTGRPPFVGPTPEAVATRVLSEPAPRLTALRVVPRIIERAVERALSKLPASRFATVGEFMSALHGASAAAPAPVPTRRPSRRRWLAGGAVVIVLLAVAGGLTLGSRAVVRRPGDAPPAAHRQLTFTGTATAPAISPDGRWLAYVAGGRSLVLHPLDGGQTTVLVPSAQTISTPRWTGDGKALVVGMAADSTEVPGTYLVPVGGGDPRKVLNELRPFDAGPDSTVVLRVPRGLGRLEIVSLASGRPARRITLPDSIGRVSEVAWSPDRRWIALTNAASSELWVVSATGGTATRVAPEGRRARWSAASDALYFLEGPPGAVDLMRVAVDRQTGRPTPAARVTSLLAASAFDVGGGRLIHTQTTVAAPTRTFVLGGSPRRVLEEQALGEGTARLSAASISPDGRWIAYAASRDDQWDVHVAAFGGGSPRVLAASPAREESPTWSPDGARLTVAVDDSAARRLTMVDARTGSTQRVGSVPGPGMSAGESGGTRAAWPTARWSASNRHIAYYAQDLRRIAVVNLQRRNESVVPLPDSVGTGHFVVIPSPNGTQLLASTLRPADERATLWLVFGNGRRWRRIRGPSGETIPLSWQRNGWVYLLRNRGLATAHGSVHLELWRMRGPLGRPELYAPLPEGCGIFVSISADATRGVCNYVRVESDLYVATNLEAGAR